MNKRQRIYEMIQETKGNFFTVDFIKENGEFRTMNCRTGVKKYLSNNGKTIQITKPIDNGILRVFDLQKNEYRSINLDTVNRITFNKVTYNF